MKLVVKHSSKVIELDDVPEAATAADLSSLLVDRTGVLARQQKLVYKGKVLTGNPKSLASLGVKEGATLLLLAAAPTAGSLAAAAAAGVAAAEAARKHAERSKSSAASACVPASSSASSRITGSRVRAWASTGVVGLRDEGLSELPDALFAAPPPPPLPPPLPPPSAPSASSASSSAAPAPAPLFSPLAVARAVDLGENRLSCLPERFVEAAVASPATAVASSGSSSTSKLARLRLAGNALSGPSALPASLSRLAALAELVLDDNPLLRSLPAAVFALPRLQRLSAARCGLDELPSSVRDARRLSELVLAGNALATVPVEIGECSMLTRLDASSNKISVLPENSLARCERLTVLRLDSNRLSRLPKDLFAGAKALHTLGLRGNEVTLDKLRETESWQEFEARRLKAADARLAGRVDVAGGKGGGAFDATADAEEWIKW